MFATPAAGISTREVRFPQNPSFAPAWPVVEPEPAEPEAKETPQNKTIASEITKTKIPVSHLPAGIAKVKADTTGNSTSELGNNASETEGAGTSASGDLMEDFIALAAQPNRKESKVATGVTPKSFDRCSVQDPEVTPFPMLMAAAKGDNGRVTALLNAGEDIDQSRTRFGRTPLICAIENKQVETTKLLLSRGANPNKPNAYGTVPVAFGAVEKNKEIVSELLTKKANPNVPNGAGFTALRYAQGESEISQLLVRFGAIQ